MFQFLRKKSIIPKIPTRLQHPNTRACTFSISSMAMAHEGGCRDQVATRPACRVVRYGWLRWCYGFDLTSCVFISFTTESCKQQNNKGATTTNYSSYCCCYWYYQKNEPTTRPDAFWGPFFGCGKKFGAAHGSLRSSLTGAGVRIMCNFAGFQLIAGAHTVWYIYVQ